MVHRFIDHQANDHLDIDHGNVHAHAGKVAPRRWFGKGLALPIMLISRQ
jgi:hypothetical protein